MATSIRSDYPDDSRRLARPLRPGMAILGRRETPLRSPRDPYARARDLRSAAIRLGSKQKPARARPPISARLKSGYTGIRIQDHAVGVILLGQDGALAGIVIAAAICRVALHAYVIRMLTF